MTRRGLRKYANLGQTSTQLNSIGLSAGPGALKDQIDTWFDAYGFDERFKLKRCGENDGKGRIREIVDESQNIDKTPREYLRGKLRTATNQTWVDTNFLKKPFLEACDERRIFD